MMPLTLIHVANSQIDGDDRFSRALKATDTNRMCATRSPIPVWRYNHTMCKSRRDGVIRETWGAGQEAESCGEVNPFV